MSSKKTVDERILGPPMKGDVMVEPNEISEDQVRALLFEAGTMTRRLETKKRTKKGYPLENIKSQGFLTRSMTD